jgi:hypothetical protein
MDTYIGGKNPKKRKKIIMKKSSQVWWYSPEVLATREAEAEEWLEPRSMRPAWEIQQNSTSEEKEREGRKEGKIKSR